jgi:hypothetical protein
MDRNAQRAVDTSAVSVDTLFGLKRLAVESSDSFDGVTDVQATLCDQVTSYNVDRGDPYVSW